MMDGEAPIEQSVYASPVENPSVVPARINLAKLESKLVGDYDAPFRLKDRLEPFKEHYDVIVIDTPPTLGLITVNALVAASHVLIPIQSSYFALEGTDDLLETIEKVKARPNPNLELLGVLVTLHDKRTTLAKDIHEQIGSVFGDRLFNTVITKSIRLEESPAYKESIFTFAPRSSGAMEYYSLSEEILSRV
jgi:chromosome partitioning protein